MGKKQKAPLPGNAKPMSAPIPCNTCKRKKFVQPDGTAYDKSVNVKDHPEAKPCPKCNVPKKASAPIPCNTCKRKKFVQPDGTAYDKSVNVKDHPEAKPCPKCNVPK